jgi:hypothetical protein
MKTQLLTWLALCAFAANCFAQDKTAPTTTRESFITFGQGSLGKVPPFWMATQTGKGEGSVWKVVADKTAPSKTGYALAQTAEGPSPLFNLCVLNLGGIYKDIEVSVAFKANAGKIDQGGGIFWHYRDANNYCIARFNPLEDNFRVYKVVDGKRTQLGTKEELKAPAGEWHTLKIRMVGDQIECFLNGKKQLDVKDSTFTTAGKSGLWTKADAQTSFDQFTVKALK